MGLVCLVCAALAVWWALPPPRSARPPGPVRGVDAAVQPVSGGADQTLDPGPEPLPEVRLRLIRSLAAVVAGAAVLGAAVLLDGGRGVALGLTALLSLGTVAGLLRQRTRGRAGQRRRSEVAQACAALAAQLRIGQVPGVALGAAAEDHPVLQGARDTQALGGDVVRVWRTQARQPGFGGLLELARAWEVATRTGAPMATTLEQVAAALAAEQRLRAVVAGELSAPRATGKVMAVLPACGVGIGYLLGGEPIGWLLSGPAGWACLVGGVLLACLGVLWIEALARRAAE
jgi:tight adherence protein B